ncbi:uncharacterized protein LOC125140620 [Tachysurus fulvidraco]|uniref:uncharacterized protein LOC125140620 n=1 Tax=Tachysurus fulvidraco TaxID=1234273 RepID=UPI001FF0278D|nr:uncharacterized protein LOC125140620 [Tachysurus fulvidraco]
MEQSLEPKDGEFKPDTSGHIRTPDGEAGHFGQIDPNVKLNKILDSPGAHVTTSGFIKSENGQEMELWGLRASPGKSEGPEYFGGSNGSVITAGETSGSRGTHSSCFISSDDPQNASGHTNILAGRVADVHANTAVFVDSSDSQTTSAGTSGDKGSNVNWAITGDAASVGDINGDLTAATAVNTSDGEDADIWDFHGSWEITGTFESNISPKVADETVDIKEPTANVATSGDASCQSRSNNSTIVRKEMPGTCETNIRPCEAVDVRETSVSLSTSGETAGSGRTSANPDELGGGLMTHGNVSPLDFRTAATVSGDPTRMKITGVSQALDGPIDPLLLMDGVLPRGQVAGNLLLGNDGPKENPECLVRPRVCVGKGRSSCCTELEMRIPNGDVDSSELQIRHKLHCEGPFTNEALEKGIRVGTCGYLVINQRSISGTSCIPVYSIREPWKAAERPHDARSSSDAPETISEPSVVNDDEEASKQETETRPESDVDLRDAAGVARPRTLRTDPNQVMSLSCDSTPLDQDNAGYFVDDGDMDVILNSLELGRRQSAPDKLQQSEHVDPEPSAEKMLSRKHGLSDLLTRSLFSWKPKESKATAAASGWRIFGKISPKGNDTGDSGTPQQVRKSRGGAYRRLQGQYSAGV